VLDLSGSEQAPVSLSFDCIDNELFGFENVQVTER